jgi:hypothetical protein
MESMTLGSSTFFPPFEFLAAQNWTDYALLDSGDGFKLEQFGPYRLIRPEPEAVWQTALPASEWDKADATYKPSPEENGGHWEYFHKLPDRWKMAYNGLTFWVQTSASRHLGVFPEQASQWDWADKVIRNSKAKPKVLNLFGYTGLASLAAASRIWTPREKLSPGPTRTRRFPAWLICPFAGSLTMPSNLSSVKFAAARNIRALSSTRPNLAVVPRVRSGNSTSSYPVCSKPASKSSIPILCSFN